MVIFVLYVEQELILITKHLIKKMDRKKDSVIGILKEKKKLILVSVIGFIVFIAIFIPSLMYISNQDGIDIDKLYQRSKDGIFVEDRFLEHGEVVPCGDDNCQEWGDGFYFDFYGKDGDWFHFITWDNSFTVSTEISRTLNLMTGWGYYSMSTELMWTGIYTVRIHNYDMENSGHIKVFVIVYNEYYPPDCPLC